MRRNLWGLNSSGSGGLNTSEIKMSAILGLVEILGVFIDSVNSHNVSKNVDGFFLVDFITGQVVVTDESLTGLLNFTVLGELSSS